MSVRRLDSNADWTFGNNQNNYIRDNEAIMQNVTTRLKSIKNDWFLDIDANIAWFDILGQKNNESIIRSEITRVTLSTQGVTKINSLDIITDTNRNAVINMDISTVYSESNNLEVRPV